MEEKTKQERRKRAKNGERNSKMMSFRVDWDVANILSEVGNKGRLLNELVRKWEKASRPGRRKQPHDEEGWETPPEENDIADYMP